MYVALHLGPRLDTPTAVLPGLDVHRAHEGLAKSDSFVGRMTK